MGKRASFKTLLISPGVWFSKNCLVVGRNLGQVSEATCKLEETTRELVKFKSYSKFFTAWRKGVINHPAWAADSEGGRFWSSSLPSGEWGHGDHVRGNGAGFPFPGL